jgi:hypothetical protein
MPNGECRVPNAEWGAGADASDTGTMGQGDAEREPGTGHMDKIAFVRFNAVACDSRAARCGDPSSLEVTGYGPAAGKCRPRREVRAMSPRRRWCGGDATKRATPAGASHGRAGAAEWQVVVFARIGSDVYGLPCDRCGALRRRKGQEGQMPNAECRMEGIGQAGMICPISEGSAECPVMSPEWGNEAPQDSGHSTQDSALRPARPDGTFDAILLACLKRRDIMGHFGTSAEEWED